MIESPALPTRRDRIAQELTSGRENADRKAALCGRGAGRFLRLHQTLSVATTSLAAVAAANVPADAVGDWFTGATAGAAALVSGLQHALRPAERAYELEE